MSGETVILDGEEADALALLLAYWRLEDHGAWLDWENLPLLSESSFELLQEAMAELATSLGERLNEGIGETAEALWKRAQ